MTTSLNAKTRKGSGGAFGVIVAPLIVAPLLVALAAGTTVACGVESTDEPVSSSSDAIRGGRDKCGDGVCSKNESCSTCPSDCSCPPPAPDPPAPPGPTPGPVVCGVPQDQINAAAAGAVLDMTGCSYSGTLLINKPLTLKGLTVNSPSGGTAVTVTASDVTLDSVTMQGPQATTFEWDTYGVAVSGSLASPVYRFKMLDSVVTRYGYGGVMMDFAYDAQILRNRVEDAVYAGIMITSAKGGLVQGNTVRRIGVYGASANSNNAYGIAVSSNSSNPQSQDVTIDGNLVEDVPTWHGLDTHAGIRIRFTNNVVRGAFRGIFITADGSGRRNYDVYTNNNRIEAPASNDRWAITSVYSTGGTITSNNLIGWPYGTDVLTTNGGEPTSTGLDINGNYNDPSAPQPVPAW